jgi:peptidoglycan/LPS O-acetylase OafA/YrhL
MEPTNAPATAPPAPARLHLKYVEGMRAVAALVVYVNHAYAQTWNPGKDEFPNGILSAVTYFMVAGHLSVTVFIVISGFCLTLPVVGSGGKLRGGTKDFFRRRARRILPPYYGALGLSLLLIATIIGQPTGTLWDVPVGVNRLAIVSHLLLLQDIFGTSKINYVFWSIAVEWQIYFLFPLFVWAWTKYGARTVVPIALLVGYGLRLGFPESRLVRANPHYIGMFVLGMLAAYVAQSGDERFTRLRVPWRAIAAVAFAVAAGLTLWLGWKWGADHFYILDFPVGILATSLLVSASRPNAVLGRIFAWKPLVFIGTFSYSVYLVHAPLLQVLWQYVFHPAGLGFETMFACFMTVGLLLILGVAYLFFRVFEEPFMRSSAKRQAVTAAMPAT